jgi:hypothetical protein
VGGADRPAAFALARALSAAGSFTFTWLRNSFHSKPRLNGTWNSAGTLGGSSSATAETQGPMVSGYCRSGVQMGLVCPVLGAAREQGKSERPDEEWAHQCGCCIEPSRS